MIKLYSVPITPDALTVRPGEPVNYFNTPKYKRPAKIRSDNSRDKDLLTREAASINAQVFWDRSRSSLTISVTAPEGFIWATCKESTLTNTNERSDAGWIRETVADLLEAMQEGFIKVGSSKHTHKNDCECDACEDYQEEVEELVF